MPNSTAPRQRPSAAQRDPQTDFADAVREAKEIIDRSESQQRKDQMRLGELADKVVHPTYADRTLAKFAKAIRISPCTLARYRSVYRAWKGIKAPGRISYAVLRELADHPDRAKIVQENPRLSKREARELAQEHKGQQKKQKKQIDWFREIVVCANDAVRLADIVEQPYTPEQLRELQLAIEPELLGTIDAGGHALLKLAKFLNEQIGGDKEAATPLRKVA
jgi:hypothetical protein